MQCNQGIGDADTLDSDDEPALCVARCGRSGDGSVGDGRALLERRSRCNALDSGTGSSSCRGMLSSKSRIVLVLFRFPSAALPRPREEGKKSSSVSSSMGVTKGLDIRDESPETCLEAVQFVRTRDAAREDDLEAMTSGSKPRLCQRSWLRAFFMASLARASESSI